ncbi:signal recognition particle protein [Aliarcobacter cibarius]|uniref:signal-recognition-particle GTPase n=1 Tax=Aliarcobacter cibarius TaxID=255507 RepID=A0A5J6REL8_9BACT|nr:signal recognition particle protein [Aliarcobacter cibarius]QEZ88530.1 signal recognition particle protein [Aliarcobacter cibarius]QKJ26569.1 signal recognition particle protein [Aliarcobacter cibarius]TLS98924.1 signal recognition particle protein [Aliarcobacter cibarius]TLS99840.1 signal recognition particle protein [Aliarcobacter cibarius]TLT03747.1 signal recognition particle protein [Aliarcobacter cibarius]
MFDSITGSLRGIIGKIRHQDDVASLSRAISELKKAFLKADVHHKTTKDLLNAIELETKKIGIGQDNFIKVLKQELEKVLTANGNQGFVFSSTPPTVVLMTGLQGSGKTTTTGKLANYLKTRKKKVLVAACDLQRLAAVEQLKQIAKQIDVDIYFDDNEKDPIKIALAAKQKATRELYDVLLVDTAGRLAIDEELMLQLKDIKNAINPNEIFYVADALTGHDATKTATTFKEKIGIDGVILSKYDGDTKGGVALSIADQVNVPLRFIGIGEKMPDLEVFIPDRIVSRLLGLGDIAGLAEKTANIIDEKKAKEVSKKIKKGEFNFNDFLEQLSMMSKLGSLKSIIGMIPGMSAMAPALKDMDFENSKEIIRIKALISSMTPKERENPDLLNPSRKKRISMGSGLSEVQVNKILKQFKNASKMAKQLSSKGGMKGLQNMLSQMGPNGMPKIPR